MPGYTNRIIRVEYPDLGDGVFVEYRNPRTAAADQLSSDDNNNMSNRKISYVIIAKLLRNWHVYDATVDDDDAPELEGPATPEMVAKMPGVIVRDLMDSITEALAGPR